MSRTNGIFIAIVVCAVLAAAAFLLTDFLGGKVYASPEEVFAASHSALQKKDLRAWFGCLTDESRDFMAIEPVIFSFKETYAEAGSKEKKAQLTALKEIQDRHGLTESFLAKLEPENNELAKRAGNEEMQRFAQKVLAPVGDRDAFCAEMFSVILKDVDPAIAFGPFTEGTLSKLKIEGGRATGLVNLGKGRPPVPMDFRKQGEGWRIDFLTSARRENRPEPAGFQHPPIER